MKNSKQFKELQQTKENQNPGTGAKQDSQSAQQTPLEQLRQHLNSMEEDIRKLQLDSEANLQDTFSQAASGLSDTQAVSQLMQIVNSLNAAVQNQGLQGSTTQYHELLSQLDKDLRQQVQSCSGQVLRSLQQGVTALAQANSALLDNQNYHQILDYVNQSRLHLTTWEANGGSPIH